MRLVRAAAAGCRDVSREPAVMSLARVLPGNPRRERRTCLRPGTPIAGSPAASSPQTFRGNQLDKQGPVRFHGVAQRLRRNPRLLRSIAEDSHVFTGARSTHTKSTSDVLHLRRVRCTLAVASRTLVIFIHDFREMFNRRLRTLKYVRVNRIKII